MTFRIKLRRDTAAAWTSANPILAAGEPGLETDTGKIKYGDGTTAWTSLSYSGGSSTSLTDEGGVTVTTGSTEHWVAAQRREGKDIYNRSVRYDSLGFAYTLTQTQDDADTVAIITKYSTTGAVLWQHTIDQADPIALAIDSNDCPYITLEDDNSTAHLIKFSDDGEILWKKSFSADIWQGEGFIEERTSTRLVMTLNLQVDGGLYRVLVLDIDNSTGEIVTTKVLVNGSENMYANGIDTDSDGNVFVTGRYWDPEVSKDKMFVEKLDSSLDRVWSKSLETNTGYSMNAGDCASDAQGNVYAIGFYDVDTVSPDDTDNETAGILIKLNSSGITQWTRRLGPGPCGQSVVGLTATDTGDLYLVTTTLEFKRDNKQLSDFDQMLQGTARMIVAKYDTAGAVLWQRYVDSEHVWEENDTFPGQAIAVYNDKFIVDFYGRSSNTIPWNFSSTDDEESDYFLVQLPTDGTELEIGNLAFKESRIPGRFVTHETSASPTTNEVFEGTVTVDTSSLTLDEVARISNVTVNSETYEYVFGADGTFTIPNDGDIKLTQRQIGYFGAIGGALNYNYDTHGRAVTADSQGNMYSVGEDDDTGQPIVVKISPEGYRLWSVSIEDDNNGNGGRANAVAIHPANGNIYVACEMYGNYYYGLLAVIDQDTGRILDYTDYTDSSNDVYLNDIVFLSDNSFVLGGSKNGNFSPEQAVTAQSGSTVQKIVVLRSEVEGNINSSWQISGTGFSVAETIASVEQYSNLTGTVDQGSGTVTVDVVSDGTGPYTYGAVTVQAGGTGYKVGHKIKYLGTQIPSGTTPANDLILTVTGVDSNGTITSATAAGDAPSDGVITGLTAGNNYNVGSGWGITSFSGPINSNNYIDQEGYSTGSYGSNYVLGDVIRIAGTDLGGTSPENDMVVTINSIGGGGEAYGWEFSGTAQSTNWNITTNTSVDFGQEGSWVMSYPLSRENLLIGDDWMRAYGTNTGDYTDRTYAIAVDSSDNIIAATQGYGQVTSGNYFDLAVIYKFNSAGVLQWARQLNEVEYHGEAKGVTTIDTDIYATHYSSDDGDTVITKLDTDGTVKWQRIVASGSDSIITAASDGDLLVAAESYNSDIDDDAIKLFKLNPNGETVYKRWLFATTDNVTRFKNGRCLYERDGYMYITAYYYANDYNSWFIARLPLDGSGTGEYGQFRYMDTVPMTSSIYYNGLDSDTNYLIGEVGGSYAGSLNTEPYVNLTVSSISTVGGNFYVNSYYPDYDYEEIRDTDGGRIVFADGTTQNTSATDIPQRLYKGQRYTLGLGDRGHHIYCTDQDDNILIPYDARVPFPIGTTITIVNDSGGSVYIGTEGSITEVMIAGDGNYSGAELFSYGIATLLKVRKEKWVITGNVQSW